MIIFICLLILAILFCGWEYVLVMSLVAVPLGLFLGYYVNAKIDDVKEWEDRAIKSASYVIEKAVREKQINGETNHFVGVDLANVNGIYVIKDDRFDLTGFEWHTGPTGYLFIFRYTKEHGLGWYAPYDDTPTFAYDKNNRCYQCKDFDIIDDLKNLVTIEKIPLY